MRSIQDRFWSDGWIRKLNTLDRYLFLYLLTNEHTNWCGIYELDIAMMAFESGIDKEDLERAMLPKLSPKIIYVDGWIYIPNWVRHHMSGSGTLSPQQVKGVEDAFSKIPERIRLKIKEIENEGIPSSYPLQRVSPSASASASASALYPARTEVREIVTTKEEDGDETQSSYEHSVGYSPSKVKPTRKWAEERMGHNFPSPVKQETHIKKSLQAGFSDEDIKKQWIALEEDDFWGEKGFDFSTVSSSLGKAKGKSKITHKNYDE
jgi:hypothetical protein